ncbi:hypothetical protein BaRGS_00033607 [Batillaria attramentaria]|uniref:Uncharacterized protein n=1 Tax=Batillaria attramentaria TaxID=370345 RepID=A0ABD0JJZ3_9CAEN
MGMEQMQQMVTSLCYTPDGDVIVLHNNHWNLGNSILGTRGVAAINGTAGSLASLLTVVRFIQKSGDVPDLATDLICVCSRPTLTSLSLCQSLRSHCGLSRGYLVLVFT